MEQVTTKIEEVKKISARNLYVNEIPIGRLQHDVEMRLVLKLMDNTEIICDSERLAQKFAIQVYFSNRDIPVDLSQIEFASSKNLGFFHVNS